MSRILINITAITFFLFWGCFSFVCYQENEKTAFKKSIALAITIPIIFIILRFTNDYFIATTLYILTGLFTLLGIILLFPTKIHSTDKEHSAYRLDERDTMFYRLEISKSQEKSNAYYLRNPKNKTIDLEWLEKPGLLSKNSLMYDSKAFAAANASFKLIEKLRSYVAPIPSNEKETIHVSETTDFIKSWAKKLGALDAGICEMKPYPLLLMIETKIKAFMIFSMDVNQKLKN